MVGDKVKRILIFRPDHIGDVILFSGAFRHIRALHPHAQITLAVQPQIVTLVERCPYVDKVIAVDRLLLSRKIQTMDMRGAYRLGTALRNLERKWNRVVRPFDLVIYPVTSPQPEHLQILRDLGVKKIIGIAGCNVNKPPDGYSNDIHPVDLYSHYLDVSERDPWRHEFLTILDFLKFLGCEVKGTDDIKPQIWVSDPEKSLLRDKIDSKKIIIGLFPGASNYIRCWDARNYAALAESIDFDVEAYAILGGGRDTALASEIEVLLKKTQPKINVFNLAGKTTLQELFKCISHCSVLIGTESAGLHMGIIAGIPTVGIVGGGHYGRCIPWGGDKTKNIFLTKTMDCFHCNWWCDRERVECIQGVTPSEVALAVTDLVRKSGWKTRE